MGKERCSVYIDECRFPKAADHARDVTSCADYKRHLICGSAALIKLTTKN